VQCLHELIPISLFSLIELQKSIVGVCHPINREKKD